MNHPLFKSGLIAIAALIILQLVGGLLFMESGTYNIAADEPHLKPVRWMLQAGRTRAVQIRSRGMHPPDIRDPSLLKRGLVLYRSNCQPCHGGPGQANEQMGRGIDPKPPSLMTASNKWDDSELFWITTHGLKLSGMPGFAPRLSETDLWAIVAFVRRMVFLSPTDYKRLIAAEDLSTDDQLLDWPVNNDYGFAQLKTRGNPKKGLELIQSYGCNSCHAVPGLGQARVGPPLIGFAERQYVAGSLANVPSNVVTWITNPKQVKPGTVMPNLNVEPREALHITAYLYTSGSSERLTALQRTLGVAKALSISK